MCRISLLVMWTTYLKLKQCWKLTEQKENKINDICNWSLWRGKNRCLSLDRQWHTDKWLHDHQYHWANTALVDLLWMVIYYPASTITVNIVMIFWNFLTSWTTDYFNENHFKCEVWRSVVDPTFVNILQTTKSIYGKKSRYSVLSIIAYTTLSDQ